MCVVVYSIVWIGLGFLYVILSFGLEFFLGSMCEFVHCMRGGKEVVVVMV